MSEKDDGGSAFPLHTSSDEEGYHMMAVGTGGMTMRDWFAGQALAGLLAGDEYEYVRINADRKHERRDALAARLSYGIADSMIAERNKKGGA